MKRKILFAVFIILLSTIHLYANGGEKKKTSLNYETIEANYLAGLVSDNCGLRNSCAYFLGEMKSQKAVIPLMKLLRCDEKECTRIYAALSLIKIGDPRGVYLVKRTAKFDDNERVKRLCIQFYNAYMNTEFLKENFQQNIQFAKIK